MRRAIMMLAIGGVFMAGLGAADAETFYIDFGRFGAETSATGWNNVAATIGGTENGTTLLNGAGVAGNPSGLLLDSTGATSGVTLTVTFSGPIDIGAAGGGADYGGPYPAAVAAWPSAAIADGFFSQPSNGGNTMTLTFSGLDNSTTYDLLFYGSRGNNGSNSSFAVTGAGGTVNTGIANVFNNSSLTASAAGISPNSGEISVVYGFPSTGSSALNAMSLSAVPEPSTIGLLGLAGGSFLAFQIHRRRQRAAAG